MNISIKQVIIQRCGNCHLIHNDTLNQSTNALHSHAATADTLHSHAATADTLHSHAATTDTGLSLAPHLSELREDRHRIRVPGSVYVMPLVKSTKIVYVHLPILQTRYTERVCCVHTRQKVSAPEVYIADSTANLLLVASITPSQKLAIAKHANLVIPRLYENPSRKKVRDCGHVRWLKLWERLFGSAFQPALVQALQLLLLLRLLFCSRRTIRHPPLLIHLLHHPLDRIRHNTLL